MPRPSLRRLAVALAAGALGAAAVAPPAPAAPAGVVAQLRPADDPAGWRDADPQASGRVTGRIPAGWRDDSTWAPSRLRYERLEEEGQAFLRVTLERTEGGRAQLAHDVPESRGETFFRLALRLRSPTDTPVEVGLRDRGPPYRFAWSVRLSPGREWQAVERDFRLPGAGAPLGLWIQFADEGQVDLAAVSLRRLGRPQLLAELRSASAAPAATNLLRHSRLPLGLEAGWMLGRECSDGDVVAAEPDATVTGPGGGPVLRVAAEVPWSLYSAPFAIARPLDPHTASVYLSGDAAGRLSVRGDGRELAAAPFAVAASSGWTRVSVAFTPDLLGRLYAVRLEARGTVRADAWQVAAGATPPPYAGPRPAEVALACGPGDASAARVHFDDEPARVLWCATGDLGAAPRPRGLLGRVRAWFADAPPGPLLRARVTDLQGDASDLPPVALGVESLQRGALDYAAGPGARLGSFRVEAWIEPPGGGAPISPTNEIVVHRLRRPRHWGADAPASPFGVHTLATTRHLTMAKAVGVNWVRLHDAGLEYLGWAHLERAPGRWTFRDADVDRYRRHGLLVLGCLSTAPAWASRLEKPHDDYFDRFYQPRDLAPFSNYVATVAARYRGRVAAWDVWNEPWIHAWWAVSYDETRNGREGYRTSAEPMADFVRMVGVAARAARAVDAAVPVLGVNTTTGRGGSATRFGGDEWSRGVAAAAGFEQFDVLAYHQYTGETVGFPGDAVERGFRTATDPVFEKLGPAARPVWMTEGSSVGGRTGTGLYAATFPGAERDAARDAGSRLCRYLLSLLANGVSRAFLYSMHAHGHVEARTADWRVLTCPDGSLHPSGAALSAFAWHVEDTRFAKRLDLAEGVHAYLFEGAGRAVAVLAARPGRARYEVPDAPGLVARDLLGNPLAGRTLGAEPVYVESAQGLPALERALVRTPPDPAAPL